jgi:hypothetical protein
MGSCWLGFVPGENGMMGEMGSFRASPTTLIEDGVPVSVSMEVTRPVSKKCGNVFCRANIARPVFPK